MRKYGAIKSVLKVVETDSGQAYLGRVESTTHGIIVYTGLAGRPKVIPHDEVESVSSAWLHPDVEYS